jgi:murein DD-endopeptidase MepM/ murein hydrolase activator NlpD
VISRRSLIASSAVFATVPLIARAPAPRFSLIGTMEQGSLIVGRTEPGARVTFDDTSVRVSPEGIFACGIEWNRTRVARLSTQFPDGTSEAREITPVARTYVVQRVNGLPQNTVTPPPDMLERIHHENELIYEARQKDSDVTWFADPFDWPAPGIMSGTFGSQRIDNGTAMAPHMGVDMANVEGTPVRAPADATVSLSDDYYLAGGFILLDHGHGVSTCYLHQSKRIAKPGDVVRRGQVIGLMGKTGRATGPHLHWAMNWFQVKLDPSRSTRTPAPPRA